MNVRYAQRRTSPHCHPRQSVTAVRATFCAVLLIATQADAAPRTRKPMPVKPTALLINGAFQYQPGIMTALAALGSDLQAQGWRVVYHTHLAGQSNDEEPVLVIGHSAGGAAAYDFAKKQVEQTKFHPTVITLDAAPWWGTTWRCPVKTCINLRTPGYPKMAGATDIDASKLTDFILPHVTVAFSSDARKVVLNYTRGLLR